MTGLAGQGTGLAETGDRAHHDRRVDSAQLGEADSEAVGHSGPVIFDNDLGLCDPLQEERPILLLFEVERDRPFAAVEVDEPVNERPHPVAARRLDFEHVGTEIGQELGRGVARLPQR